MGPLDLSNGYQNKLENYSNSTSSTIKSISNLSDDCLVIIFEYLSLIDKIRIEQVSKNWKYLSQLTWRNVDFAQIEQEIKSENEFFLNPSVKKNFIVECLKRCGNYLSTICIRNDLGTNYSWLISEIATYCHNLTDISLYEKNNNNCCTDESLKFLFNKNTNLQSIDLLALQLNGNCFESLNSDSVEELWIDNCQIKTMDYLYDILSKLKNLHFFEVNDETVNAKEMIGALNKSNCECIYEFNVNLNFVPGSIDIVTKLLSRQSKLHLLNLGKLKATKDLFDNLSSIYFEKLIIKFQNKLYPKISLFQNLKEVSFEVESLTDQCMLALSDCPNIISIDLIVKDYLLTSVGENCFGKFEKLIRFKFSGHLDMDQDSVPCLDNLLEAIENCKNLEEIIIAGCKFTKIGLLSISSLPKLGILDISSTDVTDKNLYKFIKKASNLEELKIFGCRNVTKKFIINASEFKTKHEKSKKLKIYCFKTLIKSDIHNNLSHLISFDFGGFWNLY